MKRGTKKMSKLVDNFVETLKAKQPAEYTSSELADFIEEASILFKYAEAEDKKILEKFYNIMTIYYNKIRGTSVYKEHLYNIKEIKGSLSLKDI